MFIDIDDVVEKKLAVLDCLMSQGYDGAYARKRIETTDGAFGNKGQCSCAERFIPPNAQTHCYLPLTEHALAVSRSSDKKNISHHPPHQSRLTQSLRQYETAYWPATNGVLGKSMSISTPPGTT